MVNGIGRLHKIGKQNRQQPVAPNRLLNTTLYNSNSYDNYNENIDVGIK